MAPINKRLLFPPVQVFPSGSVSVANAGITNASLAADALDNRIKSTSFVAGAIANAAFATGALAGQIFKSIIAIDITIAAAAGTGTQAIAAVNVAKSFLLFNGCRGGASNTVDSTITATLKLTSSTLVTAQRTVDPASSALTVTGYLLEVF